MNAQRKVLVIGASGFVGRKLVNKLLAHAFDTHCLLFADRVRPREIGGGVVECASSAEQDLEAALSRSDWDCIYHVAAAGVAPGQRSPVALLDGNAGLLSRVLLALRSRPPRRFLYTGSCAEYSRAEAPLRISEEHPALPESLYGAAKAAATVWGCALAKNLAIPFVALRLFHIYGSGEAPSRLVPYLLACLQNGVSAKLTGGEQVRDLLHVNDAVDALIAAGNASRPLRSLYNVCSGTPVRIRDLATTAAHLLEKSPALLEFGALPYRANEEMWIVGDNRKFVHDIQWSPLINLDEGLRDMITGRLKEAV